MVQNQDQAGKLGMAAARAESVEALPAFNDATSALQRDPIMSTAARCESFEHGVKAATARMRKSTKTATG